MVTVPETAGAELSGATLGAPSLGAAALGAADAPLPLEQAPRANAAVRASAPMRFVVVIITR